MPPGNACISVFLLLAATANTLHAVRCPEHHYHQRQMLQDATSSTSTPSSPSSDESSESSSSSSPSSPETPATPSPTSSPIAAPSTSANSTAAAPTIIILNCPGDPGCPNNTAPYAIPFNTSSGPTVVTLGPGNSTAGFWGAQVPTKPWGLGNSSDPAQPEAPRPNEDLPEELVKQITAGKLPAANLQVAFTLQGGLMVDVASFELTYKAAAISTTALVSGTPRDRWNLTLQSQPPQIQQQQKMGRHLLQTNLIAAQPGSAGVGVYAVLSVYTANPQLVWYRLSQAPVSKVTASQAAAVVAAAGANASLAGGQLDSIQQIGCTAEYCARLLAAGVLVAPSSIQFNPSYSQWLFGRSSDNGTVDPTDLLEAQIAANQAVLSQTRRLIQFIVIPVVAVLLGAVIFWQRRRLLACFKTAMTPDTTSSEQKQDRRESNGTQNNSRRVAGSADQPTAAQPNPHHQSREHQAQAASRISTSSRRSHERPRATSEARNAGRDLDETRSTASHGSNGRASRSQQPNSHHHQRGTSNRRAASLDRGRPPAGRNTIPASHKVPITTAQMMYGPMMPAGYVRIPSLNDVRASKVSRNANMMAATDFDARAHAIRVYQQQVQQLHRARSMGSQTERSRADSSQGAAQHTATRLPDRTGLGDHASSENRRPGRPAEAASVAQADGS